MTGTGQAFKVRFGVFELDLQSGELRKGRTRIKLQDQPLRVLVALVSKPGEVLTREELRQELWPSDTFVDFEHGLRVAVNKLRQALNDDAENPRFLETLPRRGYRFICPVSSPTAPPVGEFQGRSSAPVTSNSGGSLFTLPRVIQVCLGLTVLAIGAVGFWLLGRAPKLTERDKIVVADFNNTTNDTVFDGALRQGLAVELEQSPFLSLASDRQVQQTLQMMKLQSDTKLTGSVVQEVCQRINSAVVLEGSIAQIGTEYNLILQAKGCLNGESIASTKAQAQDKSHVLEALGRASYEMRKKLGESLASVEKFSTPLEQATTSSLDALRAYDFGAKTGGRGDFVAAIPWFQKAVSIDPNFAMAYCLLGMMQQNLGQTDYTKTLKKAYDLRSTVSERERLYIEFEYYAGSDSGDLENAQQAGDLWAQTYPRDCTPRGELGFLYQVEQPYKALESFQEAHRLCPDDNLVDTGLIQTQLSLGHFEEARAIADQVLVKNFDSFTLRETLYYLAFCRKDAAGMQQQVAFSFGKPGLEDKMLFSEANSAAYFGHMRESRKLLQQAVASAQRAHEYERAAQDATVGAITEVLVGNQQEARQQLFAALRLPGATEGTTFLAPLAFAELGDEAAMKPLRDKYGGKNPNDSYVQFIQLPSLGAWIALSRNEPAKAIAMLQPTPYESRFILSPNAYQRGLSYLANHQGKEAATEFQSILDHLGLVLNTPEGALSHVQMARAWALQGDVIKARAAYQEFLNLWKDADPDVPVLLAAKSEYAKLQ